MKKFDIFFEDGNKSKEQFVSDFVDEYNKIKQYKEILQKRANEPINNLLDIKLGDYIYIEQDIWFQLSIQRIYRTMFYWVDSNMERFKEFNYAITGEINYIKPENRNSRMRINIDKTRAKQSLTLEEFAEKIYDEYTSMGYLF